MLPKGGMNKMIKKAQELQTENLAVENISIENATYLQNVESMSGKKENTEEQSEKPNFEVDSIELATPKLFSDDDKIESSNFENTIEEEPKIFENNETVESAELKEPEMFEEKNEDEDLEIPAFLRRQKN